MSWFNKLGQSREENPIIYLSPEALQHVHIMSADEFDAFQNSADFVPGGRLMEVSRQYSYTLRKVAELREETVSFSNGWKMARKKEGAGAEGQRFAPSSDNMSAY